MRRCETICARKSGHQQQADEDRDQDDRDADVADQVVEQRQRHEDDLEDRREDPGEDAERVAALGHGRAQVVRQRRRGRRGRRARARASAPGDVGDRARRGGRGRWRGGAAAAGRRPSTAEPSAAGRRGGRRDEPGVPAMRGRVCRPSADHRRAGPRPGQRRQEQRGEEEAAGDGLTSADRVIAARVPGVAARDALHAHPGAAEQAVALDGLLGVARAARLEAARGRQPREERRGTPGSSGSPAVSRLCASFPGPDRADRALERVCQLAIAGLCAARLAPPPGCPSRSMRSGRASGAPPGPGGGCGSEPPRPRAACRSRCRSDPGRARSWR